MILLLQLYSWLLNVVDAFLKSHTDMRGTLPDAHEVLQLHSQLFTDFNVSFSLIINQPITNSAKTELLSFDKNHWITEKIYQLLIVI